MKASNYKGTGLLNASNHEANPIEQDVNVAFFLAWKQKHPVAYDIILNALAKINAEYVIFYVITKYMTIQFKKADALTPDDKNILKVIAHFKLLDVLMDKTSNDEKHVALNKWQVTLLDIVDNDCAEILQIGKVVGDTKAHIEVNHKIKAFDERNANLEKGRLKGVQSQKEKAEERKQLIDKINSDLLKHPDTARWSLDRRAEYIEKKLSEMRNHQINDKPYQFSTIKKMITGKG